MFRVENNVPEVYVQESRDFQLLSRLYDIVFQSTRFSIDNMRQTSSTMQCNSALLPLLGTKVGFFDTLDIDDYTYRQVLSTFPYIIRNKGSMRGINQVVSLFQRLVNTSVSVTYDQDEKLITIVFNKYSPNVDLLYKLVEYIRPAGVLIDYVITVDLDITSGPDYTTTDDITWTYKAPDGNKYSTVYGPVVEKETDNTGKRVGVAHVYFSDPDVKEETSE